MSAEAAGGVIVRFNVVATAVFAISAVTAAIVFDGAAMTIAGGMSEPTESTQAIGLVAVNTWAGLFDEARRHIATASREWIRK